MIDAKKTPPTRNIYVLDLPWGFKHPAIKYDKTKKIAYYEGSLLPKALREYMTEDFSYLRWLEDDLNGSVMPPAKGSVLFKPRLHQLEAAKSIYQAYMKGWPGFLEADKTGLGKTLSTLSGVASIANKTGKSPDTKRANLLVVCPKGVIPVWKQTLQNYPMAGQQLRVLVINYHQLQKLIEEPKASKDAKKRKTKNRQTVLKGVPKYLFDYIIFDEEHYLKNYPSSTMSLAASNIAMLDKPYIKNKSPFVISSTATPGATPLNMAMMSPWLARLLNPDSVMAKSATPATWGKFLENEGFAVEKGSSGWTWATVPFYDKNSTDPKKAQAFEDKMRAAKLKQRKDSRRIGKALTTSGAPFIARSPKDIAGWPEQQVIPMPLEVDAEGQAIYKEAWSRFRNWLRLPGSKKDSKSALVETLRYRQKSSLLKVNPLAEQIKDWVDADNQVFVSCEFLETLDKLSEALKKAKIPHVEVSGRNPEDREKNRIHFQKGRAKVVLCTVVEGVSFHSEEILPDGTKATKMNRITVILDVRQNNLNATQSMGRAHRDGQNSVAYFPYINNTVDQKVIQSFTNKTANMLSMTGESQKDASYLEELFELEAARAE